MLMITIPAVVVNALCCNCDHYAVAMKRRAFAHDYYAVTVKSRAFEASY